MYGKLKLFFLWIKNYFSNIKNIHLFNGIYIVIIDQIKKNQFLSIFFIYLFIHLNSLIASESKDLLIIDMLVKSCYNQIESCNSALFKIHKYQKNAALNKKFSCQTRLLGLEANLIMAMNSNIKRKEAKSIIQSLNKYC